MRAHGAGRVHERAKWLTREGKKACAMVSFSTLSLRENVPWAPADRNRFCTFSCPRLATTTLGERELSGMTITGAPASMSSKTLDARWGCSRTCKRPNRGKNTSFITRLCLFIQISFYDSSFYSQSDPPLQLSACQGRPAAGWNAGWTPPPQPGSAGCGHTALRPSAITPLCQSHASGNGQPAHTWKDQNRGNNQADFKQTPSKQENSSEIVHLLVDVEDESLPSLCGEALSVEITMRGKITQR